MKYVYDMCLYTITVTDTQYISWILAVNVKCGEENKQNKSVCVKSRTVGFLNATNFMYTQIERANEPNIEQNEQNSEREKEKAK